MNSDTFRFGQWQVSPGTNSIVCGAQCRKMEPRAMDVLVALCERAATVVSSEELLLRCWGNAVHGDNPVHKTIAQLRRVLGDNTVAPVYIETIRKRGYRTVAELVGERPAAPDPGSRFGPAPLACGRADVTSTLLKTACAQAQAGFAFTLVLGPSGSGKAALIRAGLLPGSMQAGDERAPLVLASCIVDLAQIGSCAPLTALGGALLDWQADEAAIFPGTSAASLGRRLEQDFEAVAKQLQRACARGRDWQGRHCFALFVDGFETVFSSMHISEQDRHAFLGVLKSMVRCQSVIVVLACRND